MDRHARAPDTRTSEGLSTPRPDRPVPPRFVPEARLGKGAFGEVWRARDQDTGRRVALKLLEVHAEDERRFVREVGALRHLDLPGVVRLVDWAQHGRHAWIAMELVEGRPFPALPRPTTWEALAPRALALLERLGPLHAAGVVHRDLKPNNILVDATGAPTILDFGLARGAGIGSTITGSNAIMGTPRYMAPEQCRGRRADARADLYAVGVMLYEALTGGVPHESDELVVLMNARASFRPRPLGELVPDAPHHVATAVDALLATDAARRPPTAEAALRLLRGEGQRPGPLPLLGDRAGVDALVERVRARGRAVVSGPPGSGRSRWLACARVSLVEDGWEVVVVPPGARPYQSLASALGVEATGPALEPALLQALTTLSLRNVVLLADGLDEVDRWSRRLLEAAHAPLLATAASGGDVSPPSLPAEALEPLFAGPERFFHLPSDAAALLYQRTGGVPGAVVAEVDAWAARGLATWTDGRVRVTRADLERIGSGSLPPGAADAGVHDPTLDELLHWVARAGPDTNAELLARAREDDPWTCALQLQALVDAGVLRRTERGYSVLGALPEPFDPDRGRDIHGALADALPVGSPARVGHLVAAGRMDEAEAEAGEAAWTLVTEGRPAAAVGLLEAAVEAGLRRPSADGERAADRPAPDPLAVALATATWADREGDVGRRARYLADRLGLDPHVVALLRAAPAAGRATSVEDSAPIPPQVDPRLELLRRDLRVSAARRQGPAEWAAEVARAVAWAESEGSPAALARARGWEADVAYTRGQLDRAAALAEAAAAGTTLVGEALAQLFRAGSLRLELGDRAGVRAAGEALCARAAAHRLPQHEARGTLLLRILAERTGAAGVEDASVIAAAEELGDPVLTANLLLVEARIAWRAGRVAEGRGLAVRAGRWFAGAGRAAARLCADGVAVVCGAEADIDALLREMEALDRPDIFIEVVGLLGAAGRLPPGDWAARIEAAAARMPGYPRDWPHGAFSVEGALKEVIRLNQWKET